MRPLGLRALKRDLRVPSFGNVAGELCKSQQGAALVANWLDDALCPEHRAVFFDAPPFGFKPALAQGFAQRLNRQTCSPITLGEETREVLSDDFVGVIALDAFRTRIPARHNTVRVQHV